MKRIVAAAWAIACLACSTAALGAQVGPVAQGAPAPSTAPARQPARILVMPFENASRESRMFWLTEAASVLLTDDLNAAGANAIERDERREAFDRLKVPPAAALTDATVLRLGQLVGASHVVIGSLQLLDGALVVRARAIGLEAGRVESDVTEKGSVAELFGIFERIAWRIAPGAGQTQAMGEQRRPPLPVFEQYIKGLLADTPATAVGYLNAALGADPGFDRARLALWAVYSDQGESQKALTAVESVAAASRWSHRARFLAGLSQIALDRFDAAFATFKALAAQTSPSPAAALNNLGIVQLRRQAAPGADRGALYFAQAAEKDPDDPDYFFNLGYAHWQARETQAAIDALREVVRRNPADGDAHFILGTALLATGNASEAARERELAKRLSSTFEEWEKRPAGEQVPKGLERIKDDVELPRAGRVASTLAAAGQRDQRELAQFHLDRGRRLYERENDRDAIVELERTLYLSPYLAEAHLLLGRIHLRNGRTREAIDALKISLWSMETAPAHAALADAYLQAKDTAAARTEAERALALDPSSADAKRILNQK